MLYAYLHSVTPPPNTAADTAHSAHSTQPALRPHRATPRVEDKGVWSIPKGGGRVASLSWDRLAQRSLSASYDYSRERG